MEKHKGNTRFFYMREMRVMQQQFTSKSRLGMGEKVYIHRQHMASIQTQDLWKWASLYKQHVYLGLL